MSIDSTTSKARMKKITKYQRFCEWESTVYLSNFINMKKFINPLDSENMLSTFEVIGDTAEWLV